MQQRLFSLGFAGLLVLAGCAPAASTPSGTTSSSPAGSPAAVVTQAPGTTPAVPGPAASAGAAPPPRPGESGAPAHNGAPAGNGTATGGQQGPGTYTITQSISDNAQLMTIAFDGLAFITGNLGADSFFPPGKVADFWGFQALRDNDPSEMGHNTDFLTSASLNMLAVLTDSQVAELTALAKTQVGQINEYGMDRFTLMTAFRRLLAGDLPSGTSALDEAAVKSYSADLYQLDGVISYARAEVMGGILHDLTAAQRATLDAMVGKGMSSWPAVTEPDALRPLTRDQKIAVMTYAGDLFSWYAGDVEADTYFCPERQGTYFGSFYLKDAPAVGNPGYSIGTTITGDQGKAFIEALTPTQADQVTSLVDDQRPYLEQIVEVRTQIATLLRAFIDGGTADRTQVLALMRTYGALDGAIVYRYATAFASVGGTLSAQQEATLAALRTATVGDFNPTGAFLFSSEIPMPTTIDTDFLFR